MQEEVLRYADSRIAFYRRELEYGSRLCSILLRDYPKTGKKHQTNNEEISGRCIEYHIRVLLQSLDNLQLKLTQDVPAQKFEELLGYYPRALHNLLIFALQRKYHPVKYFSYRSFPSYSFSEVHPTYYSEIMALEKLNICLFLVHSAMYSRLNPSASTTSGIYPPLLCLSEKSEYALAQSFALLSEPDNCLTNPKSVVLDSSVPVDTAKRAICDFLSGSTVYFPRTAPAHIRYSGPLGHEHVHRLLWLSELCYTLLASEPVGEEPNVKSAERANDIFGNYLVSFARTYAAIKKSFLDTFTSQLRKEKQPTDNQITVDEDAVLESLSGQFKEIICDIGGIHLCGRAAFYSFYFASASDMPIGKDSLSDYYEIGDSHPPRPIRIKIMLDILQTYMPHSITSKKKDESRLKKYYDVASRQIKQSANRPYYKIFKSWYDANYKDLKILFTLLVRYCPNHLYEDEGDFKIIIQRIKSGQKYYDDLTPMQLINAMWYKVLFQPHLAKNEIQWRLAIEHCAYLDAGKEK